MRPTLVIAATVLICVSSPLRAGDPAPPKGFKALFSGKDLSGWHGMTKFNPYELAAMKDDDRKSRLERSAADAMKHWKVENGELVGDGKGPGLATDADFGDVEWRLECKTNGGISLSSAADILVGQLAKDAKKWHSLRVVKVGERCTIILNDKVLVDHARLANNWKSMHPLLRKAPLQLNSQGGEIRFRNIFAREIPSSEANEILRAHNNEGFQKVFNDTDFTGWAGPIDQYDVKEGAIVCKPRKGGTIYTKAEFADFIARLEYRLPPGGNNGLAIRYPGSGDTAYVGMCEIQVLDDTAKQYAKLDPRQYNGSAYGMAPVHRGYLRPVGEWNFEEVTVKGSTIKVELNGTLILDTDLSAVTKYMANSAHPGKTRTKGHFGFAGHSDPVAFRNIQIRVLEK